MRSLRSLFGEPLDWANRITEVAAVVARAVVARIEVEAPRVVVVARAWNGRPVEAVRTGKVERSPEAVAGARQKNTFGNVSALATNLIPMHLIRRRPLPVTLAGEVV